MTICLPSVRVHAVLRYTQLPEEQNKTKQKRTEEYRTEEKRTEEKRTEENRTSLNSMGQIINNSAKIVCQNCVIFIMTHEGVIQRKDVM